MEVLEGAEAIACPVCRCKAFQLARILALTCSPESLKPIREEIGRIDLRRNRPLKEIEDEIMGYMTAGFSQEVIGMFHQERNA